MMLNAKMLSIDFILWDWKVEKKTFLFESKVFFEMRARENIAAYFDRSKWLPDRNKRARLSLHLIFFDEKCCCIQREMLR
jgi:hypothetical protein